MGNSLGNVNEGLGQTTEGLRGVLDGIFDFQNFIGWIGCHIQGIFGGYDQLGLVCV